MASADKLVYNRSARYRRAGYDSLVGTRSTRGVRTTVAKLIREVAQSYHGDSNFGYLGAFIAVLLTAIGALLLLGLVWLAFPFVLHNSVIILLAAVAIVAVVVLSTIRK
jgi:hypothetical protein